MPLSFVLFFLMRSAYHTSFSMRVLLVLTLIVIAVHSVSGNCPSYTCPDATCALTIQSCACSVNGTVSGMTAQFLAGGDISTSRVLNFGTAVSVSVSALYRVMPNVNCSNYDLSSFLIFNWALLRLGSAGSSTTAGSWTNTSWITIPASTFSTIGTSYSLLIYSRTFFGYRDQVLNFTFTVISPPPVVSIVESGTARTVSSTTGFCIPALVQDYSLDVTQFSWTCRNASKTLQCPTSLLAALAVNGTINSVCVNPGVVGRSGTWFILFTYKTTTSTLLLTVTTAVTPMVSLVINGDAFLGDNAFVASQPIFAAVSVQFSDPVSFSWSVNGQIIDASESSVVVSASTLTASVTTTLSLAVPNIISVRVTSMADATIFSDASAVVYVVPAPSLDILATYNSARPSQGNATALSDSVTVSFASSALNSTAPLGAIPSVDVSYVTVLGGLTQAIPLTTSLLSLDNVGGVMRRQVLQVPLPSQLDSRLAGSITFQVRVLYNGHVAATATSSPFVVMAGNLNSVSDYYLAALSSAADITTAAPSLVQTASILQATTNATLASILLNAAFVVMVTTISASTTIPSTTQNSLIGVLSTMCTAGGSGYYSSAVSIISSFVGSNTFNANASALFALQVMDRMDPSVTGLVVKSIAAKLAQQAAVGRTFTATSGQLAISVVKQPMSNVPSSTIRAPNVEVAIPSDFSLPGVTGSYVALAATQVTGNPVVNTTSPAALISKTVDITMYVDGVETHVSDLASPMVLVIKSSNPGAGRCWFYDETAGAWSQAGLRQIGSSGDEVTCSTTHLTTFGVFASSGSRTVLSLSAALLVAIVSMWLL